MRYFFIVIVLSLFVSPAYAEVVLNGNPSIPSEAGHSASTVTNRIEKPLNGIKIRTENETIIITPPAATPSITPDEIQLLPANTFIYEEAVVPTTTPTPTVPSTHTPTATPSTAQHSPRQEPSNLFSSFISFARIPLNALFGLFD